MTNRFLHYVNLLHIGILNIIKQSVIIKTKDLINVFPIHKTHLCFWRCSPAAVGIWSVSASLWEWCPSAVACGTVAYSLPPAIQTHTHTHNHPYECLKIIKISHVKGHLNIHSTVRGFFCFVFFTLCRNMRLCYLYEGVEAWLFLLPALDLLQGPWLVTAEPGGQFLEPLPLCTLKLEKGGKHTIEHHSVPYRLNYSRPIITIRTFFKHWQHPDSKLSEHRSHLFLPFYYHVHTTYKLTHCHF